MELGSGAFGRMQAVSAGAPRWRARELESRGGTADQRTCSGKVAIKLPFYLAKSLVSAAVAVCPDDYSQMVIESPERS